MQPAKNAGWVESHAKSLRDCKRLQEVFEYVTRHHPTAGWAPMPQDRATLRSILLNDDPHKLAIYADAVTVGRADLYHSDDLKEVDTFDLSKLNETSFANIAFVSLNHPNSEIRQRAAKVLRELQQSLKLHYESYPNSEPWALMPDFCSTQ